jgi:hypothetical protein
VKYKNGQRRCPFAFLRPISDAQHAILTS